MLKCISLFISDLHCADVDHFPYLLHEECDEHSLFQTSHRFEIDELDHSWEMVSLRQMQVSKSNLKVVKQNMVAIFQFSWSRFLCGSTPEIRVWPITLFEGPDRSWSGLEGPCSADTHYDLLIRLITFSWLLNSSLDQLFKVFFRESLGQSNLLIDLVGSFKTSLCR